MIEATSLTKRYATTSAVEGLTFAARPRVIAGRLGRTGEGSTGLIRPTLRPSPAGSRCLAPSSAFSP
jgi:ABC-2 type transport system ATP-binding protein